MKVSDMLDQKGGAVQVIGATATIAEAVRLLRLHSIGSLVVSGDGSRVEGIFSERDVVRVLADKGAAALQGSVGDAMSTPVTTCEPGEDVIPLMALMTNQRIRHVPVVQNQRLVGIISIGDVVKSRVEQLERDRKELLEYVSGR